MDSHETAGSQQAIAQELEEYKQTFELRRQADMRAIKRWQEATGRVLVWPDHADLCVWLLEQEKDKKILEEYLKEHYRADLTRMGNAYSYLLEFLKTERANAELSRKLLHLQASAEGLRGAYEHVINNQGWMTKAFHALDIAQGMQP